MIKDYDTWNEEKKIYNSIEKEVYFHEREIWWCALGINIGHEEDGRGLNFLRPIVVLKKYNRNLLLVAPTSRKRNRSIYCRGVVFKNKESFLLVNQIRVIDAKRLVRKITKLDTKQFMMLKNKLW